jgi:hypothetical protein
MLFRECIIPINQFLLSILSLLFGMNTILQAKLINNTLLIIDNFVTILVIQNAQIGALITPMKIYNSKIH